MKALIVSTSVVLAGALVAYPIALAGSSPAVLGAACLAGLALAAAIALPGAIATGAAATVLALEYALAVLSAGASVDSLAPLYAVALFLCVESLDLLTTLRGSGEIEPACVLRRVGASLGIAFGGGVVAVGAFVAGVTTGGTDVLVVVAAVCAGAALVVPLRSLEAGLRESE